jgi:hypothetical protein
MSELGLSDAKSTSTWIYRPSICANTMLREVPGAVPS